jgi:uncharacterized protein
MKNLEDVLQAMSELPSFVGLTPIGVNTKGNFKETPLHVAAIQNDIESIRILVSAGADINASGENGYTPLHEAVEQGNFEATCLLLELGANANVQCDNGSTVIDMARESCDENISTLLRKLP